VESCVVTPAPPHDLLGCEKLFVLTLVHDMKKSSYLGILEITDRSIIL
jgi:hypothetical protein